MANSDDGTCIINCLEFGLTVITDFWGYETSWILSKNNDTIASIQPLLTMIKVYHNQQ